MKIVIRHKTIYYNFMIFNLEYITSNDMLWFNYGYWSDHKYSFSFLVYLRLAKASLFLIVKSKHVPAPSEPPRNELQGIHGMEVGRMV